MSKLAKLATPKARTVDRSEITAAREISSVTHSSGIVDMCVLHKLLALSHLEHSSLGQIRI
jgi:hypothetical protein